MFTLCLFQISACSAPQQVPPHNLEPSIAKDMKIVLSKNADKRSRQDACGRLHSEIQHDAVFKLLTALLDHREMLSCAAYGLVKYGGKKGAVVVAEHMKETCWPGMTFDREKRLCLPLVTVLRLFGGQQALDKLIEKESSFIPRTRADRFVKHYMQLEIIRLRHRIEQKKSKSSHQQNH